MADASRSARLPWWVALGDAFTRTRKRLAGFLESAARGPRSERLELLLVAGLMVFLTVAMLFPQVQHLDSVPDHLDPLFSIWRLAWVAHQLPIDPIHLYDANIFWPEPYTLANSDGMPLTGAAAAPVIWLGARPVVVYNVFLLASFVLAGIVMYAFVRSLVGGALPAVVSAVAFAFYPFRFVHYVHIELLSAFWMPLALWALHRTVREPRAGRSWILLGAALAAQYLSGMYFGIFLACYLVVVGGFLVLVWGLVKASVKPLLAAALLAGALVAPSVPPYLHVRASVGGERSTAEVQAFSARPADFLAVHQPDGRLDEINERQVFPGVLIVLLALAALWPPVPAVRWAYVVGLAFAFDVSLGSHGLIHPFLYKWFLPFRGLRVPARCAMLVGLSLAILAGYGTARLSALIRSRTWRLAFATVLCGIMLFETRPTVAVKAVPAVPPVYEWFRGRPTATIVEVPMDYRICARYLLYSTEHWQRLVNGFSGSVPTSYRPLHIAMKTFPDENAMSLLRSRGVAYAVVHEEFLGTEGYKTMIERIDGSRSLSPVSRATDGRFEARIYEVIR